MRDLYEIFTRQIRPGKLMIHPHRWLITQSRLALMVFAIQQEAPMLASGGALEGPKPLLRVSGVEISDLRKLPVVLRRTRRQSRRAAYLADLSIAAAYENHRAKGTDVGRALKGYLKELDPALRLEVFTPVGYADCVSATSLIEVKHVRHWKDGLGQLCAYSRYFPGLQPILHLFSPGDPPANLGVIREVCRGYSVAVDYTACAMSE